MVGDVGEAVVGREADGFLFEVMWSESDRCAAAPAEQVVVVVAVGAQAVKDLAVFGALQFDDVSVVEGLQDPVDVCCAVARCLPVEDAGSSLLGARTRPVMGI